MGNAGFELPVVGGGGYQYGPAGGTWSFVGGTGVSGNSSAFTAGNPAAPEGVQVAFLQGGSTAVFSQQVSGFQTGVGYTVSFKAAQRGNGNNGGQDFDVYLDTTLLGTFTPAGIAYTQSSTASFTTTAGAHTLKFVGRNTVGGDNTAFIDNVLITAEPPTGQPPPTQQDVTWSNVSPTIEVTGNSIQKVSGTSSWHDAGAVSSQTIVAGDSYMEFTPGETGTWRMCGLGNTDSGAYYGDIEFAFFLDGGAGLHIYESGDYR